jgi:pimeloyl-ACP methyl ester carboxylesterase
LVHGVGVNASIWAPQIEALSSEHDVIAYDLLGHGGSALPPSAATLSHYVEQLHTLLNQLNLPSAAVVGHSMGSLVALGFALDYPERVTRLIALNSVFKRSPEQRTAVWRRAEMLETNGVASTIDPTIERWFGASIPAAERPKAQRIRELLTSVDAVGYARTYRLFATLDDLFAERLGTLAVPALFITGELDPNSSPEMAHAMARLVPQGGAEVLAGQRHMMSFVAPELVNPRIRAFLMAGTAASVSGSGQTET